MTFLFLNLKQIVCWSVERNESFGEVLKVVLENHLIVAEEVEINAQSNTEVAGQA